MRSILKSSIKRLSKLQETVEPTKHVLGSRRARVVAVATQKGGVGKTTTSISLAAGLARFHNKKVLLIDLDPQGHVTTSLECQVCAGGGSISSVLTDTASRRDVIEIVTNTTIPNLSVTPYDSALAQTEDMIGTRIGKEFVLRDALRAARTHFDVIIIDCPPNLGNLTVNGLVAADEVLIPCDPSPLALHGVHSVIETISTIAARLNPDIDILGVLMTRVDGRNRTLNEAVLEAVKQEFGEALLPVEIGICSALAKAQMEGKDVYEFGSKSRGAEQYRALADLFAEGL